MGPQPPPFACKEYWETRFQHNDQAFDWLLPASCLDPHIIDALSIHSKGRAEILHIGCGTSLLSFHLRGHVEDPTRIHNVDFSGKAIEWGLKKEMEIFKIEEKQDIPCGDNGLSQRDPVPASGKCMRWSQVSLLSRPSVLSSCPKPSYAVIIDKSTSDAIACGEDIEVFFPPAQDRIREDSCSPDQSSSQCQMSFFVHPVCILALHLALVAVPGCHWLAVSYSSDRFSLFSQAGLEEEWLPSELLGQGYPNPTLYWRIVRKEAADAAVESDDDPVHRPPILHWVYVLERTDERLDPW